MIQVIVDLGMSPPIAWVKGSVEAGIVVRVALADHRSGRHQELQTLPTPIGARRAQQGEKI